MTDKTYICHSCRQNSVAEVLDCGSQPICNRFLVAATAPEATFPLVIGQCESCGPVQISQPTPAAELRPRFDWISYNEPEGHLDTLVAELAGMPRITRKSAVGAVVFGGDT